MVESRFQALPETSNRRFSFAEKSGTGLICDWQNFWEKKIIIPEECNVASRTRKQRPFKKGPICFRKNLYVSKEPHMFEKEAHMLSICCAFWMILLLLCSTQPNSQMASTKGEEGRGRGGGGERWVKKGRGMKVQWMEHGESRWLRWSARKEESSDNTKFCWSFFNQLKKPGTF